MPGEVALRYDLASSVPMTAEELDDNLRASLKGVKKASQAALAYMELILRTEAWRTLGFASVGDYVIDAEEESGVLVGELLTVVARYADLTSPEFKQLKATTRTRDLARIKSGKYTPPKFNTVEGQALLSITKQIRSETADQRGCLARIEQETGYKGNNVQQLIAWLDVHPDWKPRLEIGLYRRAQQRKKYRNRLRQALREYLTSDLSTRNRIFSEMTDIERRALTALFHDMKEYDDRV